MTTKAVFLDRDGVLVEDRGCLTDPGQLRILDGVPAALARLKSAGFLLIVTTNQAVIARGLISESDLARIHDALLALLRDAGAPALDAIYFCPHHPLASLPAYRLDCTCRKPRPGALLRAMEEHGLDPNESFLVGDRLTDVIAGARAGCRTVLVESPQSHAPPIFTSETLDLSCQPDHTCDGLPAAADWVVAQRPRR